MKYVNELLQKTDYLQQLQKLEQLEKDREFCKHGLNHLLDTARIAWITYLEQQQNVNKTDAQMKVVEESILEKEMIYLAALLHDLGRIQEYEEGISHHIASAVMAETYLSEIGYPEEKAMLIVAAVYGHRKNQGEFAQRMEKICERKNNSEAYERMREGLGALIYFADKKSRACFYCEAAENCNWEQEKRNMQIMI